MTDETGAEWLARENRRLSERVKELESQVAARRSERDKLAAEVVKLTEERDALSSRFYLLRTDIEEAIQRADKEPE